MRWFQPGGDFDLASWPALGEFHVRTFRTHSRWRPVQILPVIQPVTPRRLRQRRQRRRQLDCVVEKPPLRAALAGNRSICFKKYPWIGTAAKWGKNPWVRNGARAIIVGGFVLGAAYLGAAFGGLCGYAAPVCSPVLAAGGGVAGGYLAAQLNQKPDSPGGVLGWRPCDYTRDLFDWG